MKNPYRAKCVREAIKRSISPPHITARECALRIGMSPTRFYRLRAAYLKQAHVVECEVKEAA